MIKNIKKLKKLLDLQYKSEAQIRIEGFTLEALKNSIKKQQIIIERELNSLAWFLVFLIIIPLALMKLGISWEMSFFVSYISGGIIIAILYKITGRLY